MGWLFGIQENALSPEASEGKDWGGSGGWGRDGENGCSTGQPPRAPVQSGVTTTGAKPVLADGR